MEISRDGLEKFILDRIVGVVFDDQIVQDLLEKFRMYAVEVLTDHVGKATVV